MQVPKNLSLPALRRICGYTQVGLAQKIRVSPRTIVAVENGTRSLSDANAREIKYATGVLPQSLLTEDTPRALDGAPYTKKYWDRWRKSLGRLARESTQVEGVLCDILKSHFKTLLQSAESCGRVFLVADEFGQMLARLLKDPGIERCYLERAGEGSSDRLAQTIEQYLSDAARQSEFGLGIHEQILTDMMHRHGAPISDPADPVSATKS